MCRNNLTNKNPTEVVEKQAISKNGKRRLSKTRSSTCKAQRGQQRSHAGARHDCEYLFIAPSLPPSPQSRPSLWNFHREEEVWTYLLFHGSPLFCQVHEKTKAALLLHGCVDSCMYVSVFFKRRTAFLKTRQTTEEMDEKKA